MWKTKDIKALVSGAVSLVNAEEEGSRIAAIGGEVHVQQGTTEKKLRPGEQVASSPGMALVPVKQEGCVEPAGSGACGDVGTGAKQPERECSSTQVCCGVRASS
jgi:hypothetical protein